MKILGISAFYHDSAAALIEDGDILAAAQEERFTRRKHDPGYPSHAIEYCLSQEGAKDGIDYVVFYEKPFLKFERLLETYFSFAPRGFSSFRMSMPLWFQEKLFQKRMLIKKLKQALPSVDLEKRLLFSEHHLSHAASAFFPSPFEKAAILTMDGVGEWSTTSMSLGEGNHITMMKDVLFPHSLGLFYSAFTYYLGFKVNSGEYKVMGLAPYGEPKFTQLIFDHLLDLKADGTFRLNLDYFDYCTGLAMTNRKFETLFGISRRKPEAKLTQVHMDIAASMQAATEEAVLRLTRAIQKETGAENLCLAGGVALNCVANGKVLRDGRFKAIWVQPGAGDAGGAIGAALAAYHMHLQKPRRALRPDSMKGAYLGPAYEQDSVEQRLSQAGARFTRLSEERLIENCVDALIQGKAIGWFQSRMEFGPRALGSRSIIADARAVTMQSRLNLKIKFRESFRPFAPIVIREDLPDWFEMNTDSPYMLLVGSVKKHRQIPLTAEQRSLFGIEKLNVPRSDIPAVTHIDYSARVQTVHKDTNPRLYRLMCAFKERTGCPVLVNTSFNVRGEPIVCSPEDAFKCFMGTHLDVLAAENCLLFKEEQDPSLQLDYKDKFELD